MVFCGRIRSPRGEDAALARFGACCTVVGGAAKGCRRRGLKARAPARYSRSFLCGGGPHHYGVSPRSPMASAWHPALCGRDRARPISRKPAGGPALHPEAPNPGGDHAFPVLITGRRTTMDERLCRSVWRGAPDSRCGTAARRLEMPGAEQGRDARERGGTSSPSRRCAPISASAAGPSTSGGRRTGRPGASPCRTAACASAGLSTSAGWPLARKLPDEPGQA